VQMMSTPRHRVQGLTPPPRLRLLRRISPKLLRDRRCSMLNAQRTTHTS
jgi:hypothetical protein